jgi:hypothetical protein
LRGAHARSAAALCVGGRPGELSPEGGDLGGRKEEGWRKEEGCEEVFEEEVVSNYN